jgi:hypothetical protein
MRSEPMVLPAVAFKRSDSQMRDPVLVNTLVAFGCPRWHEQTAPLRWTGKHRHRFIVDIREWMNGQARGEKSVRREEIRQKAD